MRFFENGPAIPDELLHARDEGRVVFLLWGLGSHGLRQSCRTSLVWQKKL